MSVRTGSIAPGFVLQTAPGEPIDVAAAIEAGPVVLLFFPAAFSGVCSKELCTVRDAWDDWAALDARVFGICPDSPFVTQRFREDLSLPFPVLADFNREVTRAYGVVLPDMHGLRDVPKRSCFVIERGGRVVYDWVSDDPSRLPDLDEVRAAIP